MSHPFSCGQETRVIPRILQLRSHWLKSEKESLRLQEAGITKEVMNSAIAQFCLEIIAKHGEPAPRLCNKDPLTLKMGSYVIELFPNVSSCSSSNHMHAHTRTHSNTCTFTMYFLGICRQSSCSWCGTAGRPFTRLYPARWQSLASIWPATASACRSGTTLSSWCTNSVATLASSVAWWWVCPNMRHEAGRAHPLAIT